MSQYVTHPVVVAGATILALTWAVRVALRPTGADPVAVALGNPTGAVPYAIGARAMGPVGGVF